MAAVVVPEAVAVETASGSVTLTRSTDPASSTGTGPGTRVGTRVNIRTGRRVGRGPRRCRWTWMGTR